MVCQFLVSAVLIFHKGTSTTTFKLFKLQNIAQHPQLFSYIRCVVFFF